MESNILTEATGIDILIVEDDPLTAAALTRVVEGAGYSAKSTLSLDGALKLINDCRPRIVLLDLSLPDGDGVEFIRQLKCKHPLEVIIVSGSNDTNRVRKCLSAGVFDFIAKPAVSDNILRAVRRADGARRLQEPLIAPHPSTLKPGFGSLEGGSLANREMLAEITKVASSDNFCALITGQPGVLKVDVAYLLHRYSGRKGRALIVKCSEEDDDQVQARFFGSLLSGEAGQFNNPAEPYLDATLDGTLVLDDLSALPVDVQHNLTDFLERYDVPPEPASMPATRYCNVIGILREPIDIALREGRLHESLLAKLSVNTILVPTLIERRDDIPFYVRQAIAQLNDAYSTEKSVSEDYMVQLTSYNWPGNLIELKNCLFAAYQSAEPGDEIKAGSSPSLLKNSNASSLISALVGQRFDTVEQQLIEATLAANNNNKSKAAKILGISLKTLYNRLASYE